MERKWWTLIAVCVATFMLLLDITIVNVALPSIQSDLDAELSSLQWVVDAYALTLASFLLVFGSLGDRLGRRRIFAVGFGIFTLASLLCGLATDPTVLNVFRALQGVGGAAMFATVAGADRAGVRGARARQGDRRLGRDGGRRGRDRAARRRGASPTGSAGSGSSSSTCRSGSPRSSSPRRGSRTSPRSDPQPIDWAGVVTFSLSLFGLIFGLIRGNPEGWGSAADPRLADRRGGADGGVRRDRGAPRERDARSLSSFGVPAFGGVSIVAWALSAGMFAMFLYMTLYIQDVLGLLAARGRGALPADHAAVVHRRADRGQPLRPDPGARADGRRA